MSGGSSCGCGRWHPFMTQQAVVVVSVGACGDVAGGNRCGESKQWPWWVVEEAAAMLEAVGMVSQGGQACPCLSSVGFCGIYYTKYSTL